MTIADGLMIVAVLLAPLIAVQVQKYLERRRESRGKRQGLFEALMATRAARVSPRHVEALNMIELEFYGEDAVVNAWRIYRDHFARIALAEGWRGSGPFRSPCSTRARLGSRVDPASDLTALRIRKEEQ